MKTVISYLDYFIPPDGMPIDDFIDTLDDDYIDNWCQSSFGTKIKRTDVSQILKFTTKIESINTGLGDCESEAQLFKNLLIPYFQEHNTGKEVDYIIYNGGDRGALEKNIPYYIHHEYDLKDAQVFQLEQNCASTLLAIHLAKCMIETGAAKRVLSLSGNIMETFEKRLISLFVVSDGIGVVEISSEQAARADEGWEVIDFYGATDGSLPDIQSITRGGDRIVDVGVDLIKRTLERNDLGVDDISLIIPQNTNFSGWNLYCDKLGMSMEKVFIKNFGGIGHMGDVDTVRNLKDAALSENINSGEYALAYAIGTGASWDTMLLRKR